MATLIETLCREVAWQAIPTESGFVIMTGSTRRRSKAEMNHDETPLCQRIPRAHRIEERGPNPDFLAKKAAEQSGQTPAGYLLALARLLEFAGAEATVGDLTETLGHRYLAHLRAEGLAPNTVATYFKCLKAFTRWMHKKGWTERDRFEDVKQPPFVRPKFDTLTVEQKTTILTEMNSQSFLGARNIAILCFFKDTGVRLEELVHLEADRVHLADRYIEVFSRKTGDWRVIPLSDEAVAVCQHYMQWRARFAELPIRRRAAAGDANHRRLEDRAMIATTFFCSWSGAPLTENAIGLMVRRLRRRLTAKGFEVRIHPHSFRHNFLREKGLDGESPSMVRRWAGHRSHEMTDYYFAGDATRLKSASSNSHDLETRALSSGERSI